MILELLQCRSSLSIGKQACLHKLTELLTQVRWELIVQVPNLLVSSRVTSSFEGRFAHAKLICQDAQHPNVNGLIVFFGAVSSDHLRWQVVQSATQSLASV